MSRKRHPQTKHRRQHVVPQPVLQNEEDGGDMEATSTIVDTLRENPIPAALVGVGLAWLIVNVRATATQRSSGTRPSGRDIGVIERGQQLVGRALHTAQDATVGAASRVRDAADVAGDAVNALAHDARDTVTAFAHRAGETVGTLTTQTQQTAQRVEQRFEATLHDNPLAVGAAAFALGTAFGLALPTSQTEDALLGEMRDRLVNQAQHFAHDAVASAQEKVTEVLGAVTDGDKGPAALGTPSTA